MTSSRLDSVINEPVSETIRLDRISFMGISVNCLSLADLMYLVRKGIEDNKKWVIANHNLHSLYLFQKNERLRSFFAAADWIHVDGMPVVGLGRLYGKNIEREHRVTYVDWTGPLMDTAAKSGWRVFAVGSEEETIRKALPTLRAQFPGLKIEAVSGYFNVDKNGPENKAVLDSISAYRPNLLMVGMGMPRQELWIHENLKEIEANIILPSGAAIEYVAGAIPTPPRWAGRIGLEWAFRLLAEPRRLASRYLIEPWTILSILIRDFIFKQRNRIDS